MALEVEAASLHEAERLGDAISEFLVVVRLGQVLDEAERPLPHIGEIGVAALHERTQQVQRCGGVTERLDLPCRIGPARLVGEFDTVDDVATIARQLLAVLLLHRRGARLGELAGDAADLHHRQRGGIGEHDRHLQEHAQEVADVVGAEIIGAGLGEALGAVAALQQETFTHGDAAERILEAARFTGKDQRRKAGELPLDRFERRLVGVIRGPGEQASCANCRASNARA